MNRESEPRGYWRSLEEKRGDEEFLRRRRDEFAEPLPGPTDRGPSGASRRDFLGLAGFSLAAAGCSRAPVREAIPFVHKPEELTPGMPLDYATTCGGCAAACPLLVKTRDGRPIKVEGNPEAPRTHGGTCAVGQATVLSLYDEARLRGPRWRGQAVTWDEMDRHIRDHLQAAVAGGGRVALVTTTVVSPTARRLLEEWQEHFPRGRVVTWEPVSAAALRRATEQSFGLAAVPHYRFDRAAVVVGLEADFLGTWLSPVEHTHGYAERRRPDLDAGMSWHAQFEARMSPTGAMADRRVPVEASEVGAVATALLRRIRERSAPDAQASVTPTSAFSGDWPEPQGVAPEALDEVAERLWSRRGESLLVCGIADVAVQRIVHAVNHLLDNFGSTIELEPGPGVRGEDEEDFTTLIEEMKRGEVHVLLLWGVNPAFGWPRREEFLAGLACVALTVSLSDRLEETSSQVDAVCPNHHFLEAWGDAEPVRGHLSLAQPTLRPLFETRAAPESLLAWMGREPDYHAYLRERWRREVFPRQHRFTDFDAFWDHSLHDGITTLPTQDPARPTGDPLRALGEAVETVGAEVAEARRQRDAGSYEVVLYEKVGIRDGRHANNPWLQELPDPVSRVTWGNCAAMAPATAAALGLSDGDVVRLEVAANGSCSSAAPKVSGTSGGAPKVSGTSGAAVELPILVQPGQAPATLAVALGYGRRGGGPVAEGVGGDAFPLVDACRGLLRYYRTGVSVRPTGARQRIATTQNHHTLEGRPIVKETTLAAWRQDPASGNHEHPELPSLWTERPEKSHAWGMAIDLNACTGCGACVVACQSENNVPVVGREEVLRGREMHWLRIDRYYGGSAESPDVVFQPMMCQHCDHAPCETVCPVLATVHSSDGLNQQIYNRCIGTRYCSNNCPYKVRRFNWFNYAHNDAFDYHMNSEVGILALNPDVVVRSRGVMEKCSLCIQRIQEGKLAARSEDRPVRDGDIRTACQQACPANAIVFGDSLDPESRLSRMTRDERFYHVLEELGVRPSVGYLTRVRHREEEPVAGAVSTEEV